MALIEPRQKNKPNREYRIIGLYAAVPGLLLGGPLIGWFIGQYADKQFGTEPYLMVAGIFLGLAGAGVEIYELVKKATALDREDSGDNHSGT